MKNLLTYIILLMLAAGCGESKVEDQDKPKLELVKDLVFSENLIYYQYYQRFGFTDACTHVRSLLWLEASMTVDNEWKKLPMSNADINFINSIPNKPDSIGLNTSYEAEFLGREMFLDVELDFNCYFKNRQVKVVLLDNGFYRLNKEEYRFEIYNPETLILYQEYHNCN